jgi:hypothetical protein
MLSVLVQLGGYCLHSAYTLINKENFAPVTCVLYPLFVFYFNLRHNVRLQLAEGSNQ